MQKIKPIKDHAEKAIQTLVSTLEKPERKALEKRKPSLSWLPVQYEQNYFSTDLEYTYCLKLFIQLEAAKRDDLPEATMRQWFLEFIKAGWTKKMVTDRYEAVLRSPKYGAIDFSDWVRAVPVFAVDEVQAMVKDRIEAIITKGKFLKNKKVELTEEDKQAIDVATSKELEFEKINEKRRLADDYRENKKQRIERRTR